VAREENEADALLAAAGLPLDDQMVAASAAARGRRRWRLQLAAESSTMGGVLVTLSERDEPVTVRCGPWGHTGRLRSVTTATCILELAGADVVLLPTAGITVVEAGREVVDDRLPASGPDLAAVLAQLAPGRPAVRLLLGDGTEVAGMLVGLGKDAAVVRLASSVATVRLSALAGCVLLARGHDIGASRPQDDDSGGDFVSLEDLGSG